METQAPMAARKLLLHEKIEVRSLEDGFLGSWHTGVVIGCDDLVRVVLYDHILRDDGPDKLAEEVKVTPAIDGVFDEVCKRTGEYRGLIRPSPPSCDARIRSLHYGLCVDLLYMDAWWEGVVFDHEDGSERRRIFFPDLGDEMEGNINDLRLSMDWDEVTDEWKPRGNWLFLELVEEFERGWPLPVSVKQMWYEARLKDDFEKLKEWTCSAREIWKELTSQVFSDNLKITIKKIFEESSIEFSEELFDSGLKSEGLFHSHLALMPFKVTSQFVDEGIMLTDASDKNINRVQEQNDLVPSSVRHANEQTPPCCSPALPIMCDDPDEDSPSGSNNNDSSSSMSLKWQKKPKDKRSKWKRHIPPSKAEYHPEAIDDCNKIYRIKKKKNLPPKLRIRAYKHLVHLGWKIESSRDGGDRRGMIRKRYFSPEGKLFYSFYQICKTFDHASELVPGSSELSKSWFPDMLDMEPERCPEAVTDYYSLCKRKKFIGIRGEDAKLKAKKVKKHLSSIGWSFQYRMNGQKREIRYTSPTGKFFFSLASACKWLLNCAFSPIDLSPALGNINLISDNLSTSKSHLPLIAMDSHEKLTDKFRNTQPSRKRKMRDKSHCIEGSLPPKRRRKTHASMKLIGDSNTDSSTLVRRSSKRVRDRIASSAQQAPQTILSWLIENNMILPRAKVQYRGRENIHQKVEGRITREGIKCSCCGLIFSLSNFEVHAGSTDRRPSANIFLEDGRSLLECQLQLKQRISNRILRLQRENKGARHSRKNDHICSVCHYGGDLILCDQCPSSFHIHCAGLKEVPDGDWFCPSCCCQICNKSSIDKENRLTTDSSFHVCRQCERRYHADCLKHKRDTNCNSKGDWFCHDTCQQIFYGLHEILGKKISMGTENLTWRLVKYIESDFSKLDESNDENLVESYSKLNVALSVMHECFEPVKEPRTRSDLMEDVIFSRWSELNRLNFKGFYTVILEKGDEMVSVATVRIYGTTVAELPLVATRFHYRRLGMCRILVEELEKKLIELGVERLVLPAIPSVLHTWTTSFGFSRMHESERLNFLAYTFLNFEGTIFCQKVLNSNLLAVSTLSTETRVNSCNTVHNNGNIGVDDISAVSEVLEGNRVADTDIAEWESTCIKTVDGNASCSAQMINVVDQQILPDCSSLHPPLEYPSYGDASCSAEALIVGDQPKLLECSPLRPPLEYPAVVAMNDNGDASCTDETVILVNQQTLHDYPPSQPPLECPAVVSTNDKKPGNNRDSHLKCYKRRRISAC